MTTDLATNADLATSTGAVVAVASPLWLPTLHAASEIAAQALPILGGVWLFTQIFLRWYSFYKGRPK